MNPRVLSMLAIAALFCGGIADAQVPRKLNYQGFLTSPSGAPINTPQTLIVRLYDAASGGNLLFTETHTPVTVSNGIFNILLGSVDVNTNPLDLKFLAQYYLGITVGTDPEMSPRQPLAASPYAIRAATADSAEALRIGGTVGQVLAGTGAAPAWSGSPVIAGNVSVGSVNSAAARLDVSGSGWFRADGNALPASAAQGVRVFYDTFSSTGNVYAYDYAAVSPLNLKLQSPGGNVAIGNTVPGSKLTVAGRIESTTGGVKFPDGTTQATAATLGGTTATNYAFAIDTSQQFIVTPNVFQDIMFNTNVQMNGWTHVSGTSSFTCPQAGLYLIQYTASGLVNGFSSASQFVRTLLNGSEIVGSQSLLIVQTGIQTTVLFGLGNTVSTVQVITAAPLSKSFIVSLNAADVVSFQQKGSDTNVNLSPAGNGGSISMTIIKIQ